MIAIDGYDINYKITGNGPETVVILQGWGTTLEVYDSIARVLAPAYRVLSVHKDEETAVYAAAHGSALQSVGHELVKQGGEVVAYTTHHVGKTAVRGETGYRVDFVEYQPP